jgi:hypothetical protein
MESEVKPVIFEVPLLPPSGNHHKEPARIRTSRGIVTTYMLTPEALAFRKAVAIFARGRSVTPATKKERDKVRYGFVATVFLGPGDRGDGDNFWKCIADGLQDAGVIHSDARCRSWHIEVEDGERDNPANPRTLICVFVIERRRTLAEFLQQMFQN